MRKKLTGIAVAVIMLFGVFGLCGCEKSYTEDEHIGRIKEKIDERFFSDNTKYSDFYVLSYTVELLYDYEEQPVYFLVEFEPTGFIYGFIYKNKYCYTDTSLAIGSYYNGTWMVGSYYNNRTDQYENKSHFYVAGIADEKKYMYMNFGEEIPAVKRDGVFIRIDREGDEETDFGLFGSARKVMVLKGVYEL